MMKNCVSVTVCGQLIVIFTLCGGSFTTVASAGCGSTSTEESAITISLTDCHQIASSERDCVTFNDSRMSVSCDDFQSAIDWTLNKATELSSSGRLQCIEMSLLNGEYKISEQIDMQNASVRLVGCGDHVTVKCDYFTNRNLNGSREIHTWYFDSSESVAFENIHFVSCGFPLRFDTVRNVLVNNCTFSSSCPLYPNIDLHITNTTNVPTGTTDQRKDKLVIASLAAGALNKSFTEAVLDVYNCQNVNITNTIIQDNSGTGRLIEPFRGNSGGIAIGYNTLPDNYFNSTVHISQCTFQNNSANGFRTPNRAVAANIYLGRGGGLGLFLNESLHNITLTISDCIFEDNVARLFGGGLFILTQSHLNNQLNILVERCSFKRNNASYGGAGVQLSYLNSGDNNSPHTVVFRQCVFMENRGAAGSGIYVFVGDDGNLVKLQHCNFTQNTGFGSQLDLGAAVALSFLTVFRQQVILPRHEIANCIFSGNRGPNGIVSIGYAPATFQGTTLFSNNHGASLRIIGSVVEFEGETIFTNNSVTEFGALQLLSFAQIRLMRGCRIKFIGNFGKLGASFVVNSATAISAFSNLLFNPKCFLLYEDGTAPPLEWDNVTVTFVENQAVVASSVYVSRTDQCSWFTDTPPYFNNTIMPHWPIWKYIDNLNVGHSDSLDQRYSFGTAAVKLSTDVNTFRAWPGQKVTLPLQGLDHFNHSTSVNARLFFNSHDRSSLSTVKFDPEIIVIAGRAEESGGQQLLQKDFPLAYTVANATIVHSEGESLGRISMEEPFNSHLVETDSFLLSPLPCPAGYSLNPVSSNSIESMQHCTCLETLSEVITCEEDQDNVIIQNNLWAIYVSSRSPNLFFYPCPSGYCRCFQNTSLGPTMCASSYSHSFPNQQCKCNREGILCGNCKNNSGVSVLLNQCVTCSNSFGTLVGVLIFLDVVALVIVSLIDKPLPMWVYPFLFYIQMAPYASESFSQGFEAVGTYLYFINSGTSFYFIYDFCLHSRLSPLVSYFLRYLPLFAALIVFPVMWLIRKLFRKKWKSLRKHGYWWIIVLIYSHVAHTSMSILNCPIIPDSNGQKATRWYIDGNIQCFTGGHIPLAFLAIFMLALCVFLIPTLMFLAIKRPNRIRNWVDPLKTGYRDEVKWWSGIELGRRLLFLLFILSFPNNTVYGMMILVMSVAVYSYVQPYKSKVANAIEIAVQLNFLMLLVLETTPLFQDTLLVFPALSDEDLEKTREQCVESPTNSSSQTWLLLPFYYLPVLGLIIAMSIYFILFLRKRIIKRNANREAEEDPYIRHTVNVTSQIVEIDYTKEEGEIELHDTLTETEERNDTSRTTMSSLGH